MGLCGMPKPPLDRSNDDDRRQWRKQEVVVGAAASRMQATAKQTLGAATRAVARRRRDGEVRLSFVQPLRRFAPAPLVGEPLAKRQRFALCQKIAFHWERLFAAEGLSLDTQRERIIIKYIGKTRKVVFL